MAYVFKLPPTVTEEIMRYAVGYPRDRLRAIAARVSRTEISKRFWKIQVVWFDRALRKFRGRFILTWANLDGFEGLPSSWKWLEYDREAEMRLLQCECEPCEPYSLQLQRTAF